MADISKTTADKLGYSRKIEEALGVHGGEVAAKFSAWLFRDEAPRALTVQELLALVGTRLREDGEALASADLAHQVELGDDVEPRATRGARVVELKETLSSVADVVRGAFGLGYARSVGLEAPLAERADLLVKQARTSARLLRETAPPATRRTDKRRIEVADEAGLLEEAADAVEAALATVQKEETEAQRSLLARDAADERWGVSFVFAGDFLATLAEAAGLAGVAERVKTSWRRRAGVAEPRDDENEDVDPNDADRPMPNLPSPFIDEPK